MKVGVLAEKLVKDILEGARGPIWQGAIRNLGAPHVVCRHQLGTEIGAGQTSLSYPRDGLGPTTRIRR